MHLIGWQPRKIEAAERESVIRAQNQPTVVAVVTVTTNPQHRYGDAYVLNPTEVIVVQPSSDNRDIEQVYVSGGYDNRNKDNRTIVQGTVVN